MLGGRNMRQTSANFSIYFLRFWSKFLISCTHVAAALESSRTRRLYPPAVSQIIEDVLVLKEENCLFLWGRLRCVKMKISSLLLTASYLGMLKPFFASGPLWPSLLLSLPLMRAVNSLHNCRRYTFLRHHSQWHSHRAHQSAMAASSLSKSRRCERASL